MRAFHAVSPWWRLAFLHSQFFLQFFSIFCKTIVDKLDGACDSVFVETAQRRQTRRTNTMQTTFIVKNLTTEMIDNVNAMPAIDAFAKLNKWAFGDLRHCVTVKNGNGAFRDRVEWNQIMRRVNAGDAALTFKCEPRRGYSLFTFEIAK